MRMEELSEHRYIKRADSVEAYLLALVQDYFEKVQITPEGSMERIIEKCVARMDEELDYDGVGVTGILLPGDVEPRVGAVDISLEMIGGEPLISPKRSAFNVDFGDTSNTACEGNDPRLSDARNPLPHTHTMADIQGLDGRISTIDGKITRALGLCHEHANKTVLDKIIYTGNKETVDLADIENMQDRFDQKINEVRDEFTNLRNTIDEQIDSLDSIIDEINRTASQLYDYIIQKNEEYKAEVNSYTDTKISEATTQMSSKLNDYVKKTELGPANEALSNVYTLVGSMTIPFSTYFTMDENEEVHQFDISQNILDELNARTKTLNDCIFEIYLQYVRDGKNVHTCLPYLSISNNVYKGMLTASVDTVNRKLTARLYCENNSNTYTQELAISNIILRVLSKKGYRIMKKSMVEHEDSVRYSKEQDDIEKWLLKIIQRYFLTETNYSKTQEEAIIVESIRRAKEYLQDHNARVFSFNRRAGVLNIDARFFNGESKFEKKTAFNKDFGTEEDTICTGNDPRLYNERTPLDHVHNVFDIDEVRELVNEYLANSDIAYVEKFTHTHSNKTVLDKIRYSGSKDKFDLALFESSYLMLLQYEELVRSISLEVANYLRRCLGDIGAVRTTLNQVLNDIIAVRESEPAWPREAKNYTENRIRDLKDLFAAWLLNYLKKDDLQSAIDYLESSYILTGELDYSPSETIDIGLVSEQDTSEDVYPIPLFNITGIVYDDYTHNPLPGVSVTINGNTVTSGSDGSYTFEDMEGGNYVISYSIQGYISESQNVAVSITSSNIPDMYLRYEDITLTINVLDGGSALSGVSNSVPGIGSATTNSNGICTLTVRPYTSYTITSSKNDYVTKTTTITTPRTNTSVTITLEAQLHSLTFIVKDSYNNNLLNGAAIVINGTSTITGTTNANGQFTASVRSYAYTAIVSMNGYTSKTVNATVSGSDATVTVLLDAVLYTLIGTVYDNITRQVLSGVSVQIAQIGTSVTNANGVYSFTLRGGTYSLSFGKDDYISNSTSVTISSDTTAAPVYLDPALHILKVIVKDSSTGSVINGASIVVYGTSNINGTTGSDGSFSTQVRSYAYTVDVSKSGYNSVTGTSATVSGADKTITVSLVAASGSISGNVINTKTNGYLEGVTITISGTSYSAVTDSNGNFNIQCAPGTYSLVFSKTGFETNNTSASSVVVRANADTNVGTIGLTPQLGANTYEVNILWTYDTDLDTHAIGVISGQNINISYSNKTAYVNDELVASLDTDTTHITTGIGGENLTLVMNSASDYINVYLYNYSKNVPISSCGVTFKVSMGPNTVGTYNVSGGTISDTTASSSGASTTSALYIARISPNGVTINNTYTSEA